MFRLGSILVCAMLFYAALSADELELESKQIQLLPHQQFPIDYLKAHSDQKGLLIYHSMGTGKTFLSIGLAESYPDLKVVIIGPRFLEAQWKDQIATFGPKDAKRYSFVTYDDAANILINEDLSKTLVVLDECHNITKYIKSSDIEQNIAFTNLYIHLRSAGHIIGLTGTPIYNDEFDLAFVLNLVSGEELVPFNEDEFKLAHMQKNRARSFWRGYMSESMLLQFIVPSVLGFVAVGILSNPAAALLGAVVGAPLFPIFNNTIFPLEKYPLIHFDVSKFKELSHKFVSFYEVGEQGLTEFPSKRIHVKKVQYNPDQYRLFLRFAEGGLSAEELATFLKEHQRNYSPDYIRVNSTPLQERLKSIPGSGREIGNLKVKRKDGTLTYSPKFEEIFSTMKSANFPQTVMYSNYFQNGIMAIAEMFEERGLQGQYAVLHPNLAVPVQQDIVKRYNNGDLKILLLHPEITEGVSLKGTRQFHVLEPVLNNTILNQVIGRAIRFRSHSHLSPDERKVDVFLWQSTINQMKPSIYNIKKEHWRARYSDLSYWSGWGKGRWQNDKNYERKLRTPDEFAWLKTDRIKKSLESFRQLAMENSIEKSWKPE